MNKSLFLFIFILSLISNSFAQNKKNLTPENLWELNRITHHFSINDNEGIVTVGEYNIKGNSGDRNLFKINYSDGNLTRLSKLKGHISQVSKTSKENIIGYLYKGHWYEMDITTKKRKNILNFSDRISTFQYSPSSNYACYTRDVKLDKSLRDKHKDLPKANARIINDLNYRHWSEWNDEKYSHLIIESYNEGRLFGEKIDALKNQRFEVPTKPFGGVEDIIWAPDGKQLIYVSKKKEGVNYATSTDTDLYLFNIRTRKTKNLTKYNKGYDTHPSFSNNGKYIVWLQMDEEGYESDKNNIIILNRSKDVSYNLTKDFTETIYDYKWAPDNKSIYFSAPFKGTNQIFKINLLTDFRNPTITQISKGEHNYSISEILDDKLIVSRQDMNRASELYFLNFDGSEKQISHVNDEIYSKIKTSNVEKRWITTSDNKQMLTWVIYPPDFDASKKYPTLLYCQGGPQSMVSQFYSYRWNFQLMAAKGYIIIAPNRRGLPGFGEEWNKAISKDWAGQSMKDYLTAVDEISKESFIDKDRIGAVGASYGGYSVYMLAGIHNKRFKSFISHCGLFNLESWYGTTEELFFANYDIGGAYWKPENKELFSKNSPHKYVENWDTPIMVIHGGKDFRVPENQGMEAFQVAKLKGLKARFLHFPDESHWVQGPQNSLVWHREFFKWLEETL